MSSYKPIDSKREEFRKYLERTGVMDALTKALVALYEEADKPEDALSYIRSYLGGGNSEDGAGDDSSKGEPKPMDDPNMKPDKSESSVVKGSGDNVNSNFKSEESIKRVGDSKPVGAEGDASTVVKDGVGGVNSDIPGRHIAESLSPEAVS